MNTTEEQGFAHAVERDVLTTDLPDFSAMSAAAKQRGGRMRLRRQGSAVVASFAVVAAVGGIAWVNGAHSEVGVGASTFATQPRPAPSKAPVQAVATTQIAPLRTTILDTSRAYAVLDAPGWTAPKDNVIADEKLWYVHGQDGISLNWRPAADYGPKFTEGTVLATTTIDGDPAQVLGDEGGGIVGVVGPVKDGRFLTLAGTAGLSVADYVNLATHVRRQ